MSDPRLVVALVRGLHGLHGRVRVEELTDRPEERFAIGSVLHPEGSDRSLTVVESAPVADGPGWWLRFSEITDRTAAEAVRDTYLEVESAGDPLPEGSVYWHEVIGVPVVDLAGEPLGTVEGIYRAGAAEVLVVQLDGRELDIPNVSTIVRTFAPREGRIVVDREALDLPVAPPVRRPRGRKTRRAFVEAQPDVARGEEAQRSAEGSSGADGPSPGPVPQPRGRGVAGDDPGGS